MALPNVGDRVSCSFRAYTCQGERPTRAQRRHNREAVWACVREPGSRRPLTDSECAYCEFWEPIEGRETGDIQTVPLWRFWPE